MKTLLSIGFIFLALQSFGQHLILSTNFETTVGGHEAGATISYESKGSWRTGVFYQQSLTAKNELRTRNLWWGLISGIPFAKTEKIKFYGVVRMGMANQNFFIITPGLETDLKVGNNFSIGAGFGIRKTYPSASFKINFIL